MLPLVPGYVSYVAGAAGSDAECHRNVARSTAVLGTVLFVLGFAVIFTLLGAAFGGTGRLLLSYQPVIEKVVGALIVLLGLVFLDAIPGPSGRFGPKILPASGLLGAPLLGAVFALGWIPCLGPTLAAVQGLSFVEGSVTRGAVLSAAYALGLGIPFLCCALGLGWFTTATGWVRRHATWVRRIGGGMLLVVGLLLLTGLWNDGVIWLRGLVGVAEIGI